VTCHDARERFSALLDERLTREDRADLYGHLATCADCRRELAAVERTVALVRGTTPVRAAAGFVDRVVAAARPAPWHVRAARALLSPWPVKLPLGAAAILLVGGLAALLFRGIEEQQRAARDGAGAKSPDATIAVPAPPSVPATPVPPATTGGREASSAERAESAGTEDRRADAGAARIGEPTPQAAREAATRAPAAARSAPAAPADVVARLITPDPHAAERGLAALAARLAGAQTGRRVDGDAVIVELAVPRERYADFTREVARLGDYRTESEPGSIPDTVRVAVRVGS
jgi:hypothetical protein